MSPMLQSPRASRATLEKNYRASRTCKLTSRPNRVKVAKRAQLVQSMEQANTNVNFCNKLAPMKQKQKRLVKQKVERA